MLEKVFENSLTKRYRVLMTLMGQRGGWLINEWNKLNRE